MYAYILSQYYHVLLCSASVTAESEWTRDQDKRERNERSRETDINVNMVNEGQK